MLGKFKFKGLNDLNTEGENVREELNRITSFFREIGGRTISSFVYLDLNMTEENIQQSLLQLKRSLEIYRYLSVDPDGRGLRAEHTSLYVIYPDPRNPWKYDDGGREDYLYRIREDVDGRELFVNYPHGSLRPQFNKGIYGDTPPSIDSHLFGVLEDKLEENDLRAIYWYNKSFSCSSRDNKEELLRLSIAFESHFSVDNKEGLSAVMQEVSRVLSGYVNEEELQNAVKEIRNYITPGINKSLTKVLRDRAMSKPIVKWFNKNFYSAGSGIRHGGEVSTVPRKVTSKRELGKSTWYAGNSSHEFLNNVYFGKRLFKFLIEDKYCPYTQFIREMAIEQMEQLLVSDEERLKLLENILNTNKPGEVTHEMLRIISSFGQSYYGDKGRVIRIVKRLLEELKIDNDTWTKIGSYGEVVLSANLDDEDFLSYEKIKSWYHALIELDSALSSIWTSPEVTDEEMKRFYIKNFISYVVHRII